MKLRTQRIHEVGGSNADFRPKKYIRPDGVNRLEYLSSFKSNQNFNEILKSKSVRPSMHPQDAAEDFYKQNRKQIREKSVTIDKNFSLLEDQNKLKIFTGDSLLGDKKQSFGYVKIKKQPKKDQLQRLINEKHEQHSTAIQETQLVGLEQRDTLEGKIDLENVREIRKALRRRYANRKNFQKIYAAWDYDGTGTITINKMYNMLNKMEIKINMDEARVLVASADEHMQGYLNLDQFMYLIFNSNETLNVDLKKMPVLSEQEMQELTGGSKVVDRVAEDVGKVKQQRKDKQLHIVLKNRLEHIINKILLQDPLDFGYIPYEQFEAAMKKVSIPTTVMDTKEIRRIYDQYKIDEHRFDYKKFINTLRNYNFVLEDLYKPEVEEEGIQMKKIAEKNMLLHQKLLSMEKPIHIIDSHEQNSWQLEMIRHKANKVFKTVERYFASKQEFEDFIKQQLPKNEGDSVSKKQLIKFFKDVFLTVGEKDVSQNELEGFLSAFRFNNHGYTPISEIAPLIYDENDKQWNIRMQWKKNRPPPPNSKLFHEDFPRDDHTIEEENDEVIRQQNGWKDSDQEQENKNDSFENTYQKTMLNNNTINIEDQMDNTSKSRRNKLVSQSVKSLKSPYIQDNDQQPNDTLQNSNIFKQSNIFQNKSAIDPFKSLTSKKGFNLNRILEKVENRLFIGSTKCRDVYRSFDIDSDGYVSQKDMVQKLKELNLLDQDEIRPFLQYFDPEQKGFVNFQEFSSKIRAGMTINNPQGKNTQIPTILPAPEKNDYNKSMLPQIKSQVQNLRNSFRSESLTFGIILKYWTYTILTLYVYNSEEQKKTRYGATPNYQNTFFNIGVSQSSPMYQNEKDRFDSRYNHRIQFQKDELAHKYSILNARISKIKQRNDSLNTKIEEDLKKTKYLESEKIKSKGYAQWAYEHRAHLMNDWQ